jgi:Fe-S oxidoreductase
MNIALIHFRVGETDGVSLEMDKWKKILDKMGHNTMYIAGSEGTSKATIIEELFYRDEFDLMLNDECYLELKNYNEEELKNVVIERAKVIEDKFIKIFKDNKIDLVVPNNLFCLGRSPYISIGLYNAIKKMNIKVINHHHDFYWERANYANPTIDFIKEILEQYFPPKDLGNQMKHAVINNLARIDLKAKKGLDAKVIPNIFDFSGKLWEKDEFNSDFKEKLGVKDNQILFLQATRVTNRKAIELAIDLISVLNKKENKLKMIGKTLYNGKVFNEDTEYVLALVGMHEGGDGYEDKLVKHAKKLNINMIVNPNLIDHSRHLKENGEKIYSLWDAYVYCDMITYPSIYEGWGNQFLEGLFAKKPQIVYEYTVFESDIKEKNFNIISLGNSYIENENGLVSISDEMLQDAANEVQNYLCDKDKYYSSVEENFKIGKDNFSVEALEKLLNNLFS